MRLIFREREKNHSKRRVERLRTSCLRINERTLRQLHLELPRLQPSIDIMHTHFGYLAVLNSMRHIVSVCCTLSVFFPVRCGDKAGSINWYDSNGLRMQHFPFCNVHTAFECFIMLSAAMFWVKMTMRWVKSGIRNEPNSYRFNCVFTSLNEFSDAHRELHLVKRIVPKMGEAVWRFDYVQKSIHFIIIEYFPRSVWKSPKKKTNISFTVSKNCFWILHQ